MGTIYVKLFLSQRCSDSCFFAKLMRYTWGDVKPVAILVGLLLVPPAILADQHVPEQCRSTDSHALQIAVVAKRDTIESDSLLNGVVKACTDRHWNTAINIQPLYEYDESDGFSMISKLIHPPKEERSEPKNMPAGESELLMKAPDVIIGPSESGLFSDLYYFLDFKKNFTPIISPIVTVQLGNETNNWFFRTNVDAAERAEAIYDFFSKRGIENFAMAYSDKIFGEIAENAFRKVLNETQEERFNSFRFQEVDDARAWLLQIKKQRPEAIGIVGSRHEVKQFFKLYERLPKAWNRYDPYIFTIVDIRSLAESAEGTYFLSVGQLDQKDEAHDSGELTLLTYDTTNIVLEIADAMKRVKVLPQEPEFALTFRNRLIGKLSGSASFNKRLSGMDLIGRKNDAEPSVMTIKDQQVQIVTPENIPDEQRVLNNWFEIRKRRFGVAPIVNIVLVVVIVAVLTLVDLRRTHRVKGKDLLRPAFLLLVSFNIAVAISVFVFAAEYNITRWDSLMGALIVGFGYSGILKTTIFETQAGMSIGLRRYYENLVVMIYDRIRRQQFEKVGPSINYIAFANSRTYLHSTLIESYAFAGGVGRKNALEEYLTKELEKEQTTLGKRKVLAKELLDEVSWFKLQERNIVPRSAKNKSQIIDPEPIVDKSVEYIVRCDTFTLRDLKADVKRRLKTGNDNLLNTEFEDEIIKSTTPRSKMATCIRWLILLDGYDVSRMVKQGLLPSDYKVVKTQNWLQKILDRYMCPIDRRKCPRINVPTTPIQLEHEQQVFNGRLIDISEGGAKIQLEGNIPNDAKGLSISTISDQACVEIDHTQINIVSPKSNVEEAVYLGVTWKKMSITSRRKLNSFLRGVFDEQAAAT